MIRGKEEEGKTLPLVFLTEEKKEERGVLPAPAPWLSMRKEGEGGGPHSLEGPKEKEKKREGRGGTIPLTPSFRRPPRKERDMVVMLQRMGEGKKGKKGEDAQQLVSRAPTQEKEVRRAGTGKKGGGGKGGESPGLSFPDPPAKKKEKKAARHLPCAEETGKRKKKRKKENSLHRAQLHQDSREKKERAWSMLRQRKRGEKKKKKGGVACSSSSTASSASSGEEKKKGKKGKKQTV